MAGYPPPQQQPYGQQPQYYGQQPVVQQPGNTTVVINQINQKQTRSWSSGICGCFDDCGVCMCATFCGPCAACQLAQDLGEFMCLYCCVPNWLVPVRTKVRTQLGIPGSICDDCCMVTFCGMCAMCQVMREVKIAKQQGLL